MNAIRIRTKVESEILNLPELKPLIGHTVEIIVLEEEPIAGIRSGTGDWDAAVQAAQGLAGYDFGAWQEQREYDLRHASDNLP